MGPVIFLGNVILRTTTCIPERQVNTKTQLLVFFIIFCLWGIHNDRIPSPNKAQTRETEGRFASSFAVGKVLAQFLLNCYPKEIKSQWSKISPYAVQHHHGNLSPSVT